MTLWRSFDLRDVNGVSVIAVIDGKAEQRMGQRLPNRQEEAKLENDLEGVIGDSDTCYDDEGNLIEGDAAKCKELRGY